MNKKHILIIDDEPAFAEVVKILLESENFAVDVASDGRQGIHMLNQRTYAAVLLDIIMPGVDGFSVLDSISGCRRNRFTPVIIITAKAQTKNILQAEKMGAKGFIIKPCEPELLIRTVRRCISDVTA